MENLTRVIAKIEFPCTTFLMNHEQNTSTVFVVEDHPLLQEAVAAIVENEPGLTFCGAAASLADAIPRIKELAPTIIVLDITLQDAHGVEPLQKIKAASPESKVLVFSGEDESVYARRMLHAGASGYLNKGEPLESLTNALRAVARNELYTSERLKGDLLRRAVQSPTEESQLLNVLTNRELQVFNLLGHGRSPAEIATELNLTVRTVDVHRANIRRKLNAESTREVLQRAISWVNRTENQKP